MSNVGTRPANEVQAGFQGADWANRSLPADVKIHSAPLRTADGAATKGILYAPPKADTVAVIMHPREFTPNHYLVPDLVEAGIAAWIQSPRSVGVDLRLEHEQALLDLAAGLVYLRGLGFRRIALLGNSGGASLHAFYMQQAQLESGRRIERTPGGGRAKLAEAEMPVADAMVLLAPHPGQGVLLQACIDPSVADEQDALSTIAALDPLDPANGFRPADAGGASYAPDFVARYAEAQRARVERLDAIARDLIRERRAAQARAKAGGTRADRIRAAHTAVMTIWRTAADLRCFDLKLDPSERKYGTVWGANAYAANYGALGFARFCLPEAWLSTWSGISSNAAIAKTGASISQPCLVVEYTGDQTVFPQDIQRILASLASSDKTHRRVRGDHHGRPLAPGDEPGRFIAGRLITDWLRERL
ncbi:MAG: alpha/beta hydrolase [Rhodospirillaceae bacterium]|nr:alpha/beta hydrolase [Rhodospirillaceae bacterium]